MATRTGRRAQYVPESIELPSIETPQYVDSDGYEVDAETFALALNQTGTGDGAELVTGDIVKGDAEGDIGDGVEEQTDYADDDIVGADGELEEEVAIVEDGDEEPREPLLSLSDSNVLNYSLMASRQHHLKHLLPHMFSHPPIPAASKLRARPPPKGTFLWPTPPPLVHPLPQREYHGPSHTSTPSNTVGSPATTTPSANPSTPNAEQPNNPEGSEPKKRKYVRNKGKDKMDGVEAPAHEIECLARVTLSIGPISFPGTELWVGRFVQPRAAAPKQPRAKRDKMERKRPSAADGETAGPKRPRAQAGPSSIRPVQYAQPTASAAAGPAGYRPPYPGQSLPPRPPPQPRAELSPDLIRRVNEAATKHPWLSQIIHKAARTQATKEELAKLGRVVNRLKEGKDVGEGPDDPPPSNGPTLPSAQTAQASTIARPSTSTSGPTSSSQPRPPPQTPISGITSGPTSSASLPVPPGSASLSSAASNTSEPLTPPPQEDDDSDSDVDMTGPRQVGGGPGGVDPSVIPELPAANTPAPTIQSPAERPAQESRPVERPPEAPHANGPVTADSSSFTTPSYRPPQIPTFPAQAPSNSCLPATQSNGVAPAIVPPMNTASQSPAPPPPPRPMYPLPPPFLLVAFKDALTEKYLLPLGSLSYISRLGEKEELAAPKPATPPTQVVPPVPTPAAPVSAPIEAHGPIKSRTRASLGRNAKPATPPPPAKEEEPPAAMSPEEEKKKKRGPPRSNLQPVAGMAPPDGTVLVSTFIPAGEWRRPDWKDLSTSLPFNNPSFETRSGSQTPNIIKTENGPPPSSESKASPKSPRLSKSSKRSGQVEDKVPSNELPARGKLLNLAAESFLPDDSDVHAVTIRLSEVSDQVWQRIKTISGMVATAEMKSLGEHEPELMVKPDNEAASATPPAETSAVATPALPVNPAPRQAFQPTERLREAYQNRKRNLFRHLLERVPPRKFLRFRLSSPRPDIVDATADRWGPRPYPISTKALYTREEEEDAEEAVIPFSPEVRPKKGSKKDPEPTVTFEMPVSLDQLDEMVAENAMKGKKGHGLDGRKRHGKRWVPGTICEGCGEANKRVWRAGPGGKGTLCNACADKWTSGTLGPLAAPGAASKSKDQAGGSTSTDVAPGTEAVTVQNVPNAGENPDTVLAEGADHASLEGRGDESEQGAVVKDSLREQGASRDAQLDRQRLVGDVPQPSATAPESTQDEGGMDVDRPPSLQIDGNQIASGEAKDQPSVGSALGN